MASRSRCEECFEGDSDCPYCASQYLTASNISGSEGDLDVEMTDSCIEAMSNGAEEARKEQLQIFKDTHSSVRATDAQLEDIFALSKEEQETMIDWLDNPRALYPLEDESVFDGAMSIIQSDRREKEWKKALEAKVKTDGEGSTSFVHARRGAVVETIFDEHLSKADDDDRQCLEQALRSQGYEVGDIATEERKAEGSSSTENGNGSLKAFIIARKRRSGPCSSIDEYAKS